MRVFISYSREDEEFFRLVRDAIQQIGLQPVSDNNLDAGMGFTEQIQTHISHSHIFIPILTRSSHERSWVHQEIGYATAMRVPCVPVCLGTPPDGMIQLAHAVVVNPDEQELEAKLRRANFSRLVDDATRQWLPPSVCAREPEERAKMIEHYSKEALANLGPQCVRVQGGLTSFSIPDQVTDHPAWLARYGDHPRSRYSYEMFRHERNALEMHAKVAGLKMIVNFGVDLDGTYGQGVKRARMSTLVRFLESLEVSEEKVSIALVPSHPPDTMLSVGDWYVGESSAGRPLRGVIQTVFFSHAPTVSNRIAEFDKKLEALLLADGIPSNESKRNAILRMREMIAHLPVSPFYDPLKE